MAKNRYYAYIIDGREKGICDSWDACNAIVSGKKARYKGFVSQQEAKTWLLNGGIYEKSEDKREKLESGIYFDAGTGRGIGVEVKVTDEFGKNLLSLLLPAEQINAHGNYLAPEGSTNNYGELMGCYIALKISLNEGKKCIFGESKLIIDYWSKGMIKKEVAEKTIKLARLVTELRREFELKGGKIRHISGDINPADLGFHR